MANELNLIATRSNFVTLAMRTNSNTTGTHTEVTDKLVQVATPDLVHATLGITDEIFELAEAIEKDDSVNVKEELGDALWFLALGAHSVGRPELLDTDAVFEIEVETEVELMKGLADVVSYVKKAYAYGKMDEAGLQRLVDGIKTLVISVNSIADEWDIDINEVRQAVIDKLVKRFGEKYSDDAADINNRDLDGEREVLESSGEVS